VRGDGGSGGGGGGWLWAPLLRVRGSGAGEVVRDKVLLGAGHGTYGGPPHGVGSEILGDGPRHCIHYTRASSSSSSGKWRRAHQTVPSGNGKEKI